jgi:hypothetical protein
MRIREAKNLVLLFLSATRVQAASNLTSLVNLFIGTASGANGGSGGNVFPGKFLRADIFERPLKSH